MRWRWCPECNRDYEVQQYRPARTVYYPLPVAGWLCPEGHEVKECAPGQHEWVSIDEIGLNYECKQCYQSCMVLPGEKPLP